jgi:hypothetical protein
MDEDSMLATTNKMTGLDLASRPGTFIEWGRNACKNVYTEALGAFSSCIKYPIHNAHLKKNLKFLQNFRPKNNTIKGNV